MCCRNAESQNSLFQRADLLDYPYSIYKWAQCGKPRWQGSGYSSGSLYGDFEADGVSGGNEGGQTRISAKGQGAIEVLALDARGIGLSLHSNQMKDKRVSNRWLLQVAMNGRTPLRDGKRQNQGVAARRRRIQGGGGKSQTG